MAWMDALQKRQEIVLGTCSSEGVPRVIVALSLGFVGSRLLIGASLMRKSLENIKETGRVSIVARRRKEHYRIDGNATVYPGGTYLDVAVKRSRPPLPENAILVEIKEVFDLDRDAQVPLYGVAKALQRRRKKV